MKHEKKIPVYRRMKRYFKNRFFEALEARGQYYVEVGRGVDRVCPICGYEGRFAPFGLRNIRVDAQCLECGSLERHRLLYLYLAEKKPFQNTSKVVHFAPENIIRDIVDGTVGSYVTADLVRDDVDHNWNIEAIDAPDASFDGIICNHVLEHVDADRALNECRRILRPDGVGIFTFPICEGLDQTYEDPAIVTDDGRFAHFGQSDHVRIFGRDVRARFPAAGLALEEFFVGGDLAARHGLTIGERVFVVRPLPAVAVSG